ncbi:MAG TPA: hypothetical protein VII00_02550 [bacterium]
MLEKVRKAASKNMENTISLSGISYEIHLAGGKKMWKTKNEIVTENERFGDKDILTILSLYERWRKNNR